MRHNPNNGKIEDVPTPKCDVLVAGGSLASLAAAIAAANASATLAVCYTDITDWPGGQLTASGVPAVDFGNANAAPSPNLVASFSDLMATFSGNPGNCWVSVKCFRPDVALGGWIMPMLASLPNLAVYLNTAVVGATTGADGSVTSVSAVQRTPVGGTSPWDVPTSAQLADWYSAAPSPMFTKTVLNFTGMAVVVDATEFGDVLVTAGAAVTQGVETPTEYATTTLDSCGQGTVMPFYMQYGATPAPTPDPTPGGGGEGAPFSMGNFTWNAVWTYRRVTAAAGSSATTPAPGDISNQNWGGGNDYDTGYLLTPIPSSPPAPGGWAGGINTSQLAAAEARAYGWYHAFKNASAAAVMPFLSLNTTVAGTGTGLAKMPYLRDTRRSGAGIYGFRLFYTALSNCTYPGPVPPAPSPDASRHRVRAPATTGPCTTAYDFEDTVAIGDYFYADTHEEVPAACAYPPYLVAGAPVLPYYIPFRALTNAAAPNLLVAGKTMAQSFFANSGTRLHPEEWATGTAAGVAAALMAPRGWNTSVMYANVGLLQDALTAIGAPLTWHLPPLALRPRR